MHFAFKLYKLFLVTFIVLSFFFITYAADKQELQSKINSLETEIKEYESLLNRVKTTKQTLQSRLRSIDISTKKTELKIKQINTKINLLETTIDELEDKIKQKQKELKETKKSLSEVVRKLYKQTDKSYIEILLGENSLSDFWNHVSVYTNLQSALVVKSKKIKELQNQLNNALETKIATQSSLQNSQKNLQIQKQSLEIQKQEKQKLLKLTKNKEKTFQQILEEKIKAKKELEKELAEIESKLAYTKTTTLPVKGNKVFIWPLKKFRITQYFGNTPFARSGAYKGRGHNGLDMGVPLGSPVYSVADGIVMATGNTDAFPGCLSYGKWILIKHNNGLATLYAHLSRVIKSPGQQVLQGEVVAYSGSTGYSTGPHLHLSVYDAGAVQVVRLGDIKKTTRCKNARIPIAPWKAYFNPLDFLPKI